MAESDGGAHSGVQSQIPWSESPEAGDILLLKISSSLLRVIVLQNFAIVNFLIISPSTTRMCDIKLGPNILLIVLGKFYYMQC